MRYANKITVRIRILKDAAIITIPSDILKILDIDIGSTLVLEVTNKKLIAHPVHSVKRKRYTLAELSQGITPNTLKTFNKKTEWAREGKSIGDELAD